MRLYNLGCVFTAWEGSRGQHASTAATVAACYSCRRCCTYCCLPANQSLFPCGCSNPPKHGAAIVAIILSDPELFAQWKASG